MVVRVVASSAVKILEMSSKTCEVIQRVERERV